ncbi:MAG: sensor histidine kinase [Rhodocyclales bacterium]|nr:sensor histidine kinase [Rhodocyclales bacterium]
MHSLVDKYGFQRISLPRQFALVTAAILIVCIPIFGTWVGHQIERNAVNRAASTTAFYVESILAAELHDWSRSGELSPALRHTLDDIFVAGPLHNNVVSFKLWAADGSIVYSTVPAREGRRYPVSEHLAAALAGQLQADVTDLAADDELLERRHGEHLLEIYVPVRSPDGRVIAVAEFYHPMENIEREILSSQRQSWILVVAGAAAIFLMLYGLMQRANKTIVGQQRGLREQLAALRSTLKENELMRERISAAGAQTTALNEQLLRRLAADLHDGPAQDLAFALMRFDELARPAEAPGEMAAIQTALRSSLDELRAICAGLGVPGIAELSTAETVRRAVRDVERRMNLSVVADVDDSLDAAPLAVKITAYRLVQESLTNCWRHARHDGITVKASRAPAGDLMCIEVSDRGPGFDAAAAAASGRLGLAFMRERVRLLGGHFEVATARGQGTTIRAWMPLTTEEAAHA